MDFVKEERRAKGKIRRKGEVEPCVSLSLAAPCNFLEISMKDQIFALTSFPPTYTKNS